MENGRRTGINQQVKFDEFIKSKLKFTMNIISSQFMVLNGINMRGSVSEAELLELDTELTNIRRSLRKALKAVNNAQNEKDKHEKR